MFHEVRLASSRDIPGIMEIEQSSFPLPWDIETISACVESPSCRTWTSRIKEKITGYTTAELDSGTLHILNLAVRDVYRNQGIAMDLLRSAEQWGQRLGAAISYLEVRETALPAMSLYSKAGYVKTRTMENYYPDGENGLEFQKKLHHNVVSSHMAKKIVSRCRTIPRVGVILGSGLSWLADEFEPGCEFSYEELLGDSAPEIAGHPGKLVFSGCGRFIFMLGRRHYYQGYSGDEISMLPGVLADLGVSVWILTTSSGAVDTELQPGDVVLFRDHANFSGCIPESAVGRIRKSTYSAMLEQVAEKAATETGTRLRKGVFACVSGPAYETSAEIRYLRNKGFSTVSMSTVPTALLLSSRGFEVAAVSLVTNAVSPGAVLSHSEVLSSQEKIREMQGAFLSSFITEAASIELR